MAKCSAIALPVHNLRPNYDAKPNTHTIGIEVGYNSKTSERQRRTAYTGKSFRNKVSPLVVSEVTLSEGILPRGSYVTAARP